MWTHREKCNACGWGGYRSDLSKRKPTAKENKKYGAANDPDINKKYPCCPKCKSFDVEGHELEDDHLQGI